MYKRQRKALAAAEGDGKKAAAEAIRSLYIQPAATDKPEKKAKPAKLSARGVATRLSSARSKQKAATEREEAAAEDETPPKPSAGVGLVAWSRGAGRN